MTDIQQNGAPRALLLFSGGFDSTVLLHDLLQQGYEVELMFFKYGQLNLYWEMDSIIYWRRKFPEINLTVVNLPNVSWWKSNMLYGGKPEDKEYLESRNLLFLSYAISYAESVGIKEIFTGFVGLNHYNDTNPVFVSLMNAVGTAIAEIDVKAPYVYWGKDDIFDHAKDVLKLNMREILENTVSCNVPVAHRSPCGKCPDCKAITNYLSRI